MQQNSPLLYFPVGVYYFGSGVTLNEEGVGCSLIGDSAPRDFVYIPKKDEPIEENEVAEKIELAEKNESTESKVVIK